MKELKIGYGVTLPEIEVQLKKQGLKVKDCDKYEKVRFALNFCLFHEFLTESQINKAFQKMHNEISEKVILAENMEV